MTWLDLCERGGSGIADHDASIGALTDSGHVGVVLLDADGVPYCANRHAAHLLDWAGCDAAGAGWTGGLPAAAAEDLLRAVRGALPTRLTVAGRKAAGAARSLEIDLSARPDGSLLATLVDVPGPADGIAAAVVEAIAEAGIGYLVCESDLTVLAASPAARKMFGLSRLRPGETAGRIFQEMAERGDLGPGEVATLVAERIANFRAPNRDSAWVRQIAQNKTIEILHNVNRDGRIVQTYRDVTGADHLAHIAGLALSAFDIGFIVFDADFVLIADNHAARAMFADAGHAVGDRLETLLRRQIAAGHFGDADPEAILPGLVEKFRDLKLTNWRWRLPDGRTVEIHRRWLDNGNIVQLYRDVTESARAQDLLSHAFDAMVGAFVLWGADDRLVHANRRFQDMMAELAPHVGMPVEEFFERIVAANLAIDPQFDGAAIRDVFWQAHRAADGVTRRFSTHDGRVVDTTIRRLPDGSTVAAIDDVTEKVALEDDVRRLNLHLVQSIDATEQGFSLWDNNERLVHINQYQRDMTPGFDMARGSSFGEFADNIAAAWAERVPEAQARALADAVMDRFRAADGVTDRILSHYGRIFDITNRRLSDGYTAVTAIDVTDRLALEDNVRELNARLRDAIDVTVNGFALWSADNRLAMCNQGFRDINYDVGIEIGMTLDDFVDQLARSYHRADPDLDPDAFAALVRARHDAGGGGASRYQVSGGRTLDVRVTRIGGGYVAATLSDVTRQLALESEIREINHRLKESIDVVSDGFIIWGPDDRIAYLNARAENLLSVFGVEIGMHLDVYLGNVAAATRKDDPAVDAGPVLAWMRRLYRAGDGEKMIYDGFNERTFELFARRLSDGHTVVSITDITEKLRLEEGISALNARIGDLVDAVVDAFCIYDPEDRIVRYNARYAEIHADYAPLDGIADGEFPERLPNLPRAEKPGRDIDSSIGLKRGRHATADGTPHRYRDVRGRLLEVTEKRLNDGYVAKIVTDITEAEKMKLRLRDTQELLMSSISIMLDGFIIWDQDGRAYLANDGARRIWGRDMEGIHFDALLEVVADAVGAANPGLDVATWKALRHAAFDAADGQPHEVRLAGGRWYRAAIKRIGNGMRATVISDITDLKEAILTSGEARRAAEQANAEKTAFLSRMSHELRTPLNAIIGFSEILTMENPQLMKKAREYAKHINFAGSHLLALVDDLLDVSGIESGRVAYEILSVAVFPTIAQCVTATEPTAASNDVRITAESGEPTVAVRADPKRFRQVLLNFLSNAVKFNRPGGTAHVAVDLTAADRVRIAVSDTGIGIEAARITELFKPFSRLDADARSIGGSGIGLALSKSLVEAMGGRVGAESESGRGSTFWFELPRADLN